MSQSCLHHIINKIYKTDCPGLVTSNSYNRVVKKTSHVYESLIYAFGLKSYYMYKYYTAYKGNKLC